MNLRDAYHIGLTTLVQQRAFLWELKKPALSNIYNRLQNRYTTRDTFSMEDFVNKILNAYANGSNPADAVYQLNFPSILEQITVYGLRLMLTALGYVTSGSDSKAQLVQRFLHVKPLQIILTHGTWSQQKTIKRADYTPDLISQWFNERCLLLVDGLFHSEVQNRHLCSLDIKDGSVLEIRNVQDAPAPQDSSCSSLNKIDISN